MYKTANRLTLWNLALGMVALFIGGSMGPLQKLEHVGINLYSSLREIGIASYYQGLTIHGVLNALVWTTFFICGFLTYATVNSLKRELSMPRLNIAAFIVMVVGLVTAAVPLLGNLATVLYTFYPPMRASGFFYVGLTLFVVGSWMVGWGLLFTYRDWRRENKGEKTPFVALASLITMVMWQFATLGVAAEILFILIPFAFGLTDAVDPQVARTFFWFFGHPLVYFWLLPAYLSWYAMLPKQANGKMFSESMARLVFWLFLILSIPVGIHHQYTDPGVPTGWKAMHATLTLLLFVPSMITAFSVVASLEIGGRNNGGTGLLGWIRKLPWKDPSYAAQNLAMILFVFGGIGGLTNASYNLNVTVHNTMWVPGHFHLTVGSAVTLSFMGISYWLFPALVGKPLWSKTLGLWQSWTWFIGMILMSNGLHILGLNFGVPRRSSLGVAEYLQSDWQPLMIEAMIGGIILGVSGLLYYINIIGTAAQKKKLEEPIVMPVAEPYHPEEIAVQPAWLDRWRPWIVTMIALIVISYGPVLFDLISRYNPVAGFKVW
ncbi:MAG: cbb3-type cytochrome c oxidase subunit I [Ardenticatenaceae bacterium]|nr:cbb3-type cytochrome c oxidase subunit I [Ardenticatenaceae bacterium]